MEREKSKLYQDRLYGTKVLSLLAVAIIDTAEFQRLAGFRQLGFANLAYRGAVHTRFEHSVGTYFICRTIMRRLAQNHDRFLLDHPGRFVSEKFAVYPRDWHPDPSLLEGVPDSHQARWRGVTEVVSAAALIHDIGHVPFGHTLEDEFAGIYEKHDALGGPRVYEMLFNERSELSQVFSGAQQWLQGLSNEELRGLIYVILSWKENVDLATGFISELDRAHRKAKDDATRRRLASLRDWHAQFVSVSPAMFHPFMSDIVGNTICADLLDYLPRDRDNLGMEQRLHERLQRYFTIRNGTHYRDEGLRLSLMVTRPFHGGQRRDVATAVLDVMRERYEMAERVYYHHKKAAASAMLAKLAELADEVGAKPTGGSHIYPAPWTDGNNGRQIPDMTHFADSDLIDYLGKQVTVADKHVQLQMALHLGLRFRRKSLYRTLLVIDSDLADASPHPIAYFAKELRGTKEEPTNKGRLALERDLVAAAGPPTMDGEVLIYCPSPDMQAKEVHVRLEIDENRVLPLSVQRKSFAYHDDIKVLEDYYKQLWRSYIFVSPAVFGDSVRCRAIVDKLCEQFDIPKEHAYGKVRNHDFRGDADRAIAGERKVAVPLPTLAAGPSTPQTAREIRLWLDQTRKSFAAPNTQATLA